MQDTPSKQIPSAPLPCEGFQCVPAGFITCQAITPAAAGGPSLSQVAQLAANAAGDEGVLAWELDAGRMLKKLQARLDLALQYSTLHSHYSEVE